MTPALGQIRYAIDGASEVYPGLWVGSRPEGVDFASLGFDLIVICESENDFAPAVPDAMVPRQFLRCPLEDREPTASEVTMVDTVADLVAEELASEQRILIVCYGGLNRSGLVAARALTILGQSPEAAIAAVRAARAGSGYADAFGGALNNVRFEGYLRGEWRPSAGAGLPPPPAITGDQPPPARLEQGLSDERLAAIVAECLPHSDMEEEGLLSAARAFALAHNLAPGGLSIEIGTRNGGSALAFLCVLDALYGGAPPMLFTVDPYGDKPYFGLSTEGADLAPYGDRPYLASKFALYPFAHHAHWYCRGVDFLEGMGGRPFWRAGRETRIDGFTFVLLDGDHDHVTLGEELRLVMPRLHRKGIVLVDNVDCDPETGRVLAQWKHVLLPAPKGEGKGGRRQALVMRS